MPTAPHRRLFFPFAKDPSAPELTFEGLLASPFVPGVSVITIGPAKGHRYYDDAASQMVPVWIDATSLATTMSACQVYANGVRVNDGHLTAVTDAIGSLSSFRIDGPKLRADFTLFPTYSEFRHVCKIIATIPDTIGLSIDFDGTAEVLDGKAYPRVTDVCSTDLVPAPAANEGGLFHAKPGRPLQPAPAAIRNASQVEDEGLLRSFYARAALADRAAVSARLAAAPARRGRETNEEAISRLLSRR